MDLPNVLELLTFLIAIIEVNIGKLAYFDG